MDTNTQFKEVMQKVGALKKSGTFDLALEEDLSIALMNLISLEEHCYFTGIKLEQDGYYDLLDEIRSVRKDLLARMISTHEGETWCISKHLLAATMRLMEVGTKYHAEGKKADAKKVFSQGAKLYNMFWALRMKLITAHDIKKIGDHQLNVHDKTGSPHPWKYEDILKKLVDCCDE